MHWLYQRPFILELVLECVRKFSMGCIQTGHMYLLPPQVFGRSWRGFWLGVKTCSLQLVSFIDIKHFSSYFSGLILLIFDLCVSYSLNHISLILKIVLGCVTKFSVGRIQNGHTDLLPLQVCGRSWQGWRFFYCACLRQYTD